MRVDFFIGILHRIPIELQKSLATSPLAEAAWKDITPLARNEWICWVISAKNGKYLYSGIVKSIIRGY